MRVLLIEDNATFAETVERAFGAIGDVDLVWGRSRDSAIRRLQTGSFDLILLDRKLPTGDGVLDDHIDHGWAVYQHIRENSPGIPVWFLTGTEDADFASDFNNVYGRSVDLHGRGVPEQMYRVFWKKRISDCLREVKAFAAEQKTLERIHVVHSAPLQLNREEMRTLRLYSRRNGGSSVQVSSLNGGLSNSRVLKVRIVAADARILATAAVKVSDIAELRAEEERYRNHIVRLTPGGFPQLAATIDAGAANTGGLFYGMIGHEVKSLFDKLIAEDTGCAAIPAELRTILDPWYSAKTVVEIPVAQIRRQFIGDVKLYEKRAELDGIDTSGIEAKVVRAASCCQHRDLHCANVVFGARGQAMLIDFGDTGESYAAVDPVTLELSTVFHSQHSNLPQGWPTEADMQQWPNLQKYIENCSFGGFIFACREWANAVAASYEEVVAVAYSYALRQLKYQDTDKLLARSLIRACMQYFGLDAN